MRWFRLRQKWGTCLALAALLIQLAVASTHVHLDPNHGHVPHVDITAGVDGGNLAIAAADEQDSPTVPHAPGDHCAICALIHLAQSLIAPTAPIALALPDAFVSRPAPTTAAALAAPQPARFRARAPPTA